MGRFDVSDVAFWERMTGKKLLAPLPLNIDSEWSPIIRRRRTGEEYATQERAMALLETWKKAWPGVAGVKTGRMVSTRGAPLTPGGVNKTMRALAKPMAFTMPLPWIEIGPPPVQVNPLPLVARLALKLMRIPEPEPQELFVWALRQISFEIERWIIGPAWEDITASIEVKPKLPLPPKTPPPRREWWAR